MDQQWTAQWIWGGEAESPRNEWRCFRREFDAPADIDGAALRISADSRYVLYVNGSQVGRGPVRSWPAEQFYDTYDVAHLLIPGKRNTIAALVLHFGVSNFYYIRGRGGLIAELAMERPDGTAPPSVVATDGSWRTEKLAGQDARSPRMSCQQGFAEIYDAGAAEDGWIGAGFDDSGWQLASAVAAVGEGPWKKLVPRDIPFLTEEKVYPSRVLSVSKVSAPVWTAALDLRTAFMPDSVDHANGVVYSGYVATLIEVARPTSVTLGFPGGLRSEQVTVNGKLCGGWHGELPARYSDVQLEAGSHLVVIDVTSWDHGGSFHMAVHAESPFELRSPLAPDDTDAVPLALIGPFDTTVRIDYEETRELDREQPDFVRARSIAGMNDLASFSAYTRPFPEALYCPQDVMGANMWRTSAVQGIVTPQLQRLVMPSPEPAEVSVAEDGSDIELVIDFGKEWSGFVGFELEAAAGTVVDLYGLEYMKDDYRQHTYGLDNTIRYTCREGRQRYLSPVRRGFRYLIATVRGAVRPVKLFEVFVHQSNYPVAEIGSFRCSDPLLDKIWEISRHTTRLCMEDTFVDCPAYEQVFWVGDARNEALVNYYVFGSLDIVKRCLNLVPGSADITPLYLDQVPSGWKSVIPNWTFFWAIACAEYVEHTGDAAFAARIWPAVQHTLSHYLLHIDESGLLNMKGWNLLDWAPIDQPNDGIVTHQNIFLCKALRKGAELAAAAGVEAEEAAALVGAAAALQAAINERLWDETKMAYLDCIHADGRKSDIFSMQTQVVAALCGIAEGERQARLENVLLQPPPSFVQIGSPFMSFFYYETLTQAGHHERIVEDIRRNFGQMIRHDATTCWEMYPNFAENRASSDMLTRSHCHAWSAAPGYFLGTSILGVQRLAGGWSRAAVAPQPCGLSWARGRVPLPQGGTIDVEWSIEDGAMKLAVSAPHDIELDVVLPEGLAGEIAITRTAAAGF